MEGGNISKILCVCPVPEGVLKCQGKSFVATKLGSDGQDVRRGDGQISVVEEIPWNSRVERLQPVTVYNQEASRIPLKRDRDVSEGVWVGVEVVEEKSRVRYGNCETRERQGILILGKGKTMSQKRV